MSTLYPGSIDGYSQLRVVRDGIEEILARDHNDLRSAVVAVERTLGVNPQGGFGTVAARMDDAYSNLAGHVLGGLPRHNDGVITTGLKTDGSFTLSIGTVQSQLQELLGYINSTSVFLGLSDTPSAYTGLGGKTVGLLHLPREREDVDILVRLPLEERSSLEALRELKV
ncbi:MAG: hypothetical protein ACWGQW_10980, partial [bacterium]